MIDLQLLVSGDEGRTWNIPNSNYIRYGVTGFYEHPGHLLKLNDGRILLTYGKRYQEYGIGARVSNDEGQTWGPRMAVIEYGGDSDDLGGYPSSVQLKDGTIVTAYYSDKNKFHDKYHMGVVRWKISKK